MPLEAWSHLPSIWHVVDHDGKDAVSLSHLSTSTMIRARIPKMDDNRDDMYSEDYMPGSGFEKYLPEPIDDYAIAYVEKTFSKPISELLTYGAELRELIEYVITNKAVCEFSYELQCCVFDLFPRWYIAQTPFRNEIYPDIRNINWQIWLKHWEQLGAFFENSAT